MRAGYVAVIGKTNVGKSTLINKLIGQKINIVSPKQQTTRTNVLGILTKKDYQIVFIDTPGIHKSLNQLDKAMSKSIRSASEGADVIVYIFDATKPFNDEDIEYVKSLTQKTDIPVIVAISKIDIADKGKAALEMLKLNELDVKEIVPISAQKNKNIEELEKNIVKYLPENDLIFADDEITDKSTSYLCGEIVREKVLMFTNQEIPHGVMCVVTSFEEKKNITDISVDVICEKDSHKSIIIGKGGASLKRIGASARIDIEKLIGTKVMLKLFIKVEKDWRNKPNLFSTII